MHIFSILVQRLIGDFRKGRVCVDDMFCFRIVIDNISAKGKKTMHCLHGSWKAYNRVDWLVF